jgi:enediyne biosynthesis protein E4
MSTTRGLQVVALLLSGIALSISSIALSSITQEAAPITPRFIDETASSGLSSRYEGDWEFMVGGGVATFDCDDNGFPDVFLAGGTNKAQLYRNTSVLGGALKFARVSSPLELTGVTGGYPLDVDSDGRTDLAVLRVGENALYRGLGACRFARANESWGFDGGDDWSASFAATWERGNTFPTLAVGNYIDRSKTEYPWGSCTPSTLQRPSNPSSQRFAAPIPLKPSYCALSMLFSDWNRSGTPALRVSNDREYYKGGQEQLWKLETGKAPALYTAQEGWRRLQIWGMGIAAQDLDGDTFPEYYLTSMADQKLQKLSAGSNTPSYTDIAFNRGVTAHRPYTGDQTRPSTGWHAQFADVNNDAKADLFVAKGNVAKMPDFALEDPNNLLLGLPDGTFLEAGDKAGVASTKRGRGAQVVDLNLDGRLDLIVVNRWDNAELWRNDPSSTPQNWLQLRLRQPGANRDLIGAWIEVQLESRVLRQELTVGGGHASGNLGWVHFGLGNAPSAKVRVQYPGSLEWSAWQDVDANRFYLLERGRPPRVWTPR